MYHLREACRFGVPAGWLQCAGAWGLVFVKRTSNSSIFNTMRSQRGAPHAWAAPQAGRAWSVMSRRCQRAQRLRQPCALPFPPSRPDGKPGAAVDQPARGNLQDARRVGGRDADLVSGGVRCVAAGPCTCDGQPCWRKQQNACKAQPCACQLFLRVRPRSGAVVALQPRARVAREAACGRARAECAVTWRARCVQPLQACGFCWQPAWAWLGCWSW